MKKILGNILAGIVVLYFMSLTVMTPYYNWQYAKEHGFIKWLILGEIVATLKSTAWPYFVFFSDRGSQTNSPDERHYVNSKKACDEAMKIIVKTGDVACLSSEDKAKTSLTADEQQDLRYFIESFQEHGQATIAFNNALDAGHSKGDPSGVGTIPKEMVDNIVKRNEKALELSRKAKSEVLARVHPELASMVRDHYERSLQLFAESLQSGDTMADLEAQRHANEFADWWDSHKKEMPILKKVMNQMKEMPNQ